MKIFLAASVAILSSATLRADFSYQVRTEITGGALLNSAARAKQPAITRLIKWKRMAAFSREHSTIVDLGSETIIEIDFSRKTYRSTTFAQVKQTLDRAMTSAAFQVSAKTGGTKAIGLLTATDHIFTITGPPNLAHIFLEAWMLPPPGLEEWQSFSFNLASKLGYAYAFGL